MKITQYFYIYFKISRKFEEFNSEKINDSVKNLVKTITEKCDEFIKIIKSEKPA